MTSNPEDRIEQSWHANATAWSDAVRQGRIPSRSRRTNAAVVDAVLDLHPQRVLDVGCGEGWLARALASDKIEVVGIDASPRLIEDAEALGGARFMVCTYDELVAEPGRVGSNYDVIVCNFSLFDENITPVLRVLASRLRTEGTLVIQTLHPCTAGREEPYKDGWRMETFGELGPGFSEPMPWYFRTIGSWVDALVRSGYAIADMREPVDADCGAPLSLLLIAKLVPTAPPSNSSPQSRV